jgi:beta-glucosidase
VPPFRAAVDEGVATAMESYHEVNGVPVASSDRLLTRLLRHTLGFTGVLVTDYREIRNLHSFHR